MVRPFRLHSVLLHRYIQDNYLFICCPLFHLCTIKLSSFHSWGPELPFIPHVSCIKTQNGDVRSGKESLIKDVSTSLRARSAAQPYTHVCNISTDSQRLCNKHVASPQRESLRSLYLVHLLSEWRRETSTGTRRQCYEKIVLFPTLME